MTKFTIKHQDKGVPPASVEVNEGTTIVLGIVFSHVADIFEGILEAVAEHYKIDPKEMIDVVKNHPSVTEIALHPAVYDLGYMPEIQITPEVLSPAKACLPGKPEIQTTAQLQEFKVVAQVTEAQTCLPGKPLLKSTLTEAPPAKTKKFKIKKNTIE